MGWGGVWDRRDWVLEVEGWILLKRGELYGRRGCNSGHLMLGHDANYCLPMMSVLPMMNECNGIIDLLLVVYSLRLLTLGSADTSHCLTVPSVWLHRPGLGCCRVIDQHVVVGKHGFRFSTSLCLLRSRSIGHGQEGALCVPRIKGDVSSLIIISSRAVSVGTEWNYIRKDEGRKDGCLHQLKRS